MKRILLIGLAAVLGLGFLMPTIGCKRSNPPAWALTAPERTVGDVIASANAAVVKYEADQKAAKAPDAKPEFVKAVSNPQLKLTMQRIQQTLTIAQPGFNTWEAALKTNPNAPQPAELAGAIASLQALLGQLPSLTQ